MREDQGTNWYILRLMCDDIDATDGMRSIIRQIWEAAGWAHAVATLRGWGAS